MCSTSVIRALCRLNNSSTHEDSCFPCYERGKGRKVTGEQSINLPDELSISPILISRDTLAFKWLIPRELLGIIPALE